MCSLSTGRSGTLRRRAACVTIAPAMTSTSLFASAIVFPASMAARTVAGVAASQLRLDGARDGAQVSADPHQHATVRDLLAGDDGAGRPAPLDHEAEGGELLLREEEADRLAPADDHAVAHAPGLRSAVDVRPSGQIAAVDRNILRIAVWEFAGARSTPVKVAINEAVELAKAYGSDSAPRFVNGVLGSLADPTRPPAGGAWRERRWTRRSWRRCSWRRTGSRRGRPNWSSFPLWRIARL